MQQQQYNGTEIRATLIFGSAPTVISRPRNRENALTVRKKKHAFYIIDKLRQFGHKAYIVGGGVRDLLLNVQPKDFDVSTSASPDEIRSLFRSAILIDRGHGSLRSKVDDLVRYDQV